MPTKTKAASKERLTPRQAVAKAEEFVRGLYPREDLTGLRLEAVELSDGDEDWLVTVSFLPRVYDDEISAGASLLGGPPIIRRLYKEVHVRARDGEAHAMITPS
jgi:hypothetical protein